MAYTSCHFKSKEATLAMNTNYCVSYCIHTLPYRILCGGRPFRMLRQSTGMRRGGGGAVRPGAGGGGGGVRR